MRRARDPIVWGVLVGFLAAYLLLFVLPTFLNASHRMVFPRYIPTERQSDSIGVDSKNVHYFVAAWRQGMDPYTIETASTGVFYPPLTLLVFFPLGLASADAAYLILMPLAVISFVILALLLPWALARRLTPITLLLFATGLFSYGLQFELERGQFNVIAVCLAFLAIYLFHFHSESPPLRLLSYVLLTIAIQIKLYPAIFLLALVRDWSKWKQDLRRLLLLAAANLALLFALGPRLFMGFGRSLAAYATNVTADKLNHSSASFAAYLAAQSTTPTAASRWFQAGALVLFLLVLGTCVYLASRRRASGPAPDVLLACTLGALIMPARSFDYTLAYLPAPLAIFLSWLMLRLPSDAAVRTGRARPWLRLIAASLVSLASFWTLYSYTNKPDVFALANNFPALLVILILTPLLAAL